MKHKAGGKITRSHSSVIDLGARFVSFIEKEPSTKKISLGLIKTFPGGRKSKNRVIKIVEEPGYFKIEATEGSSHQTIRVYLHSNIGTERKGFVERVEGWVRVNGWEFRYLNKGIY